MSDAVISVEHLSKRYRLGVINTGTFKDDLKVWFAQARGKPNPLSKVGEADYGNREGDTIWALKDINFTVQRGEALGIIGRNGAGKSTLLKILSRVTTPTEGHIHVKGRIASLLEVGTGFHPELTGRENIYLNGAIMGMSRAEVNRKLDEIVDFSGVERYIDTPVKRYSSGMYVRLAFAVAAHLEPEILIVDEVLAVGDAEFQKKCLGKMGEVAGEGRTILFVSHNMGAIEALCRSCIWLDQGTIKIISNDVSGVISRYIQSSIWNTNNEISNKEIRTKYFSINRFSIHNSNGENGNFFLKSENINIGLVIDMLTYHPAFNLGYALYEREKNNCLWWSFCKDMQDISIKTGLHKFMTTIPAGILNDGAYRIELLAAIHNQEWILAPGQNAVTLEFNVQGGILGSAITASTSRPGLLFPIFSWNID